MSMNATKVLEHYQDELEREVYRFANYKCSLLPDLRRRANGLLALVRDNNISMEDAELQLGDLQLGYMEAME